ncbi:nonsense-mediated mRNA decay factor SMG7 [Pseudoliparis swirei]|uniref:nonsense-mediated mRNA decay factor SMG7 n=1 Tax=Pseudoliparis swirei TaxID=2059687 RepID=UPI0024BED05C|nr:nonsense-mediated mRNA decay factor SMG7 [Pseudoliparis swirei]
MNLCATYLRQAEALKADMTDSKLGAAEVWTSRQALQDLYQKMLVTDLEYALDKKVEQDLWNHAFKNQITTLQSQAKNRANPNRGEVQANLSLFLEAASGFYTQLLQELCTVFNVDLPCRVKSSQLGIMGIKAGGGAIVTPQPSSCSYICQHCLVHLGDIARYRNQTSQAESYYRHAAQLVPSNGQPYNQLAILASSKGDHLTTIFYYCRSIAVKFPFPAASTNLQKALSKALESRDEAKTKWSVSDFLRAFIKFHGHVYLSRGPEQLDPLRERLEELCQRLILQKAFSSQQLVHITVINLFGLHQLRDLSGAGGGEQSFSGEQQTCWFQLLGLFMSFLGVMCSRALLNQTRGEEIMGECPLPAIKVSLDWLKLRPAVFPEAAVDQRQHVWPWLVSILNGFQPKEDDVSCCSVTPLPEEFELQGFLALRPALRSLDFTKGHQGVLLDRDGLPVHARHQRLISLGKWVADNQPGLIRCRASDEGLLVFLTDIPERAVEEPQEAPVLQESSNGEQPAGDGVTSGLKSVLSAGGRSQSSWPDCGERPVVTFKENIKPREPGRSQNLKDSGKERRDLKGSGVTGKAEVKRDGKRKSEPKKTGYEKTCDPVKQVKAQTELRKTPVSEAKKTPVTQTTFIPIHHPGAFPPLPSRPGFPPSAYVIPPPPVAFPGLQVNPGFTFSSGVPVPGPFLQAGKPSHIPYSQQRPSAPGPGSSAPGPLNQGGGPAVHLQVQQSPTKPGQQMGKSPPHHPGPQQYMQVQDQPAQMWSPAQKMSLKGPQQQAFYLGAQDPLRLYEHQLDKKNKFPLQDFYWEQAYRRNRAPPGGPGPEHDGAPSRAAPFDLPGPMRMDSGPPEAGPPPSSLMQMSGFPMQEYNQNSIFSQAYGKSLPPGPKPDAPMMHQEPSLYSLFEGTPWSPSLPASSDHSTPASQSPHSSNPSSLPSSPPTHSHGALPFSNFGPIGTPDSRDRRMVDRWKADKTGERGRGPEGHEDPEGRGPEDTSWHQAGPTGSSWTNQESPMEESTSTVLLDSLKSIWSSSMVPPGPSALEQLLLQQKQKLQRGHGAMNPPH